MNVHSPRHSWDGIGTDVGQDSLAIYDAVADAASAGQWTLLLQLLEQHVFYINSWRPGDEFGYAPLHHAALLGAPRIVCEKLVELGAWRSLRTPRGVRPKDIAVRRGRTELAALLEPLVLHRFSRHDVLDLEQNFHALIYGRAASFVNRYQLRLPQLECLIEMTEPSVRFGIPGMCGAFSYELVSLPDGSPALDVWNWCRTAAGSLERHSVTTKGYQLTSVE